MEFNGVMYLTILELLMFSLHISILALPRASITACLDLKYSGTGNYVLNSVQLMLFHVPFLQVMQEIVLLKCRISTIILLYLVICYLILSLLPLVVFYTKIRRNSFVSTMPICIFKYAHLQK